MGRCGRCRHLVRDDHFAAVDGDEVSAPQPWLAGRLCPATSNLPTRMMAASWRTLCAAMQRREAVGVRSGGQGQEDFMAISAARFPCATCAGRMTPPGLELITQKEVEEMARNTKLGKCELCGEMANVGMNHGTETCTKCTHIQAALANRPQVVARAARSMGKAEDLIKALIPDGGSLAVQVTATLLQEISGIVGTRAKTRPSWSRRCGSGCSPVPVATVRTCLPS